MGVVIDGIEYIKKEDKGNNSGYRNSGNGNSGDWNLGDRNSGDRNSGNENSGDRNSGNWNSGYRNLGDRNSGDRNSGNENSGYRNSGDRNSGNGNSGYRNSGNWNSGNWNSGNWNSGYWNSGYLNTNEPFLRMFNKSTKFTIEDIGTKVIFPDYFSFVLVEFIYECNMTKAEREKYPDYKVIGGYLKRLEYKEAWKLRFVEATKEDVAKTLELPNFDYKIFEEISGITKKMIDEKLNKKG